MTEERSPGEDCFDMMVEALKTEPASTPCVFSDQMGRGRTTAGMITACLIKELQITTELRSVLKIEGAAAKYCLLRVLLSSANSWVLTWLRIS